MRYGRLGKTGIEISAVTVGCSVGDMQREVIAAISIGSVLTHFTKDGHRNLIRIVKDASYEISRRLRRPG